MTLTQKVVDFDKMFKISLLALKFNGSHPSVPRNKTWLLKFFMMHGIFTLVFIIIIYNICLSVTLKNYANACRNGTVGIMYCVISFSYFTLVTKQNMINRIMKMMKEDFAKDIPEDARSIVITYAQKGKNVTVQWLILVMASLIVFMSKHLFLELYTYVTDDWKLLPAFPLTYPSPVEEYKEQPVVFTLLYLLFLYYLVYAAIMYVGFVPLGPMFMLHACGQLEIVKMRSLALYSEELTAAEVEVKVNEVVKHLQYIYGYVYLSNPTSYKLQMQKFGWMYGCLLLNHAETAERIWMKLRILIVYDLK